MEANMYFQGEGLLRAHQQYYRKIATKVAELSYQAPDERCCGPWGWEKFAPALNKIDRPDIFQGDSKFVGTACPFTYTSKVRWFDDEAHRVVLAADDHTLFVGFSGTETKADWVKDIKTTRVDEKFFGERFHVHAGFQDLMRSLMAEELKLCEHGGTNREKIDIMEYISRSAAYVDPTAHGDLTELPNGKRRQVIFTGHSLGGAMATYSALRFKELWPENAVSVCTFGCPRFIAGVGGGFKDPDWLEEPGQFGENNVTRFDQWNHVWGYDVVAMNDEQVKKDYHPTVTASNFFVGLGNTFKWGVSFFTDTATLPARAARNVVAWKATYFDEIGKDFKVVSKNITEHCHFIEDYVNGDFSAFDASRPKSLHQLGVSGVLRKMGHYVRRHVPNDAPPSPSKK